MRAKILILLFISTSFLNSQNFVKYVNPFMGTNGHGHVYPGATVPFGMVQLSPDNGRGGWDWCSGYNYSDSLIAGFSHTHLSGTGIGDLCDISFMPFVSKIYLTENELVKKNFQTKFNHKNEKASPGFYSVQLDNKIKVELTASLRTGLQQYVFPKGENNYVKIDLGFAINWDTPVETYIKVIDSRKIVGYRLSKGWAEDQRVYFVTEFSKPFSKYLIANDTTAFLTLSELKSKKAKIILKFDDNDLLIKTSISSVSIENAEKNLLADKVEWDFKKTKLEAEKLWNKELSKIVVKSKDKKLLTTFYTSLYRTMLAPIIFNDANGEYKGADGKIHKAENYNRYSIFSLWDTFRAEHPLFTIFQSERVNDLINSMLAHYREYGLLPVWELLGNETNCMIGYHAIPVIADAILKGYNGFDHREAYTAMKLSAMQDQFGLKFYREFGYIPADSINESVSRTLEYAYDDWCIAQVAKKLGEEEDYKYFLTRSEYYKNLFDPVTKFMRGKFADGKWRTPFNPKVSDHHTHDFTEANSWQYSFFVPHDIQGLINLYGGKEIFERKVDSLFTIDSIVEGEKVSPDISGMVGQYAHGNEPSHHAAYLFNFVGQAWKTQKYVNHILRTLYNSTPDGLCGNEDCGQMSAWYVLSSLGIYSFNPADQKYVIGSPLFDEAIINLSNGKSFKISASNVSQKNIYIKSAKLNGKLLSRSFITHDEILNGGNLVFQMSSKPNTKLWSDINSYPQSETKIIETDRINKNEYAEKVKQDFLHAWNAYKRYAWGYDELKPLTKTSRNWYEETLLMTPVDAFSTMKLMKLENEANETKKLIFDKLTFDKNFFVSNFEITIRLLGGLISAFQLDGDIQFLKLAEDLGNRLLPVFNSQTGMPYQQINLKTGEKKGRISNPAEIGTLMIEFGTLSKLTGNPIFYEKAKKAFVECYNRRSSIGLVGTTIDVETGEWKNKESHISGMIDSYYEYMIKSYLLFKDDDFKKMYESSITSVNKYLYDEVETGAWYGRADMNNGLITRKLFGALDAFIPAVLVLGGDIARAEKIQNSCYKMWNQFGIEPEEFNYNTFEITHKSYVLRPEIIESAFYLYRSTKDQKYLEMGITFFESLRKYCKVDEGYASLKNVMSKEKLDKMESFLFAETFKYLYLLFAPEETLDLSKYVFNTEAHPIKIVN
ncbi:MAG: GH92 family glycosyl hydrolase [Melioribacteraceae bacterium]|nr:GH92 family glycosyl hydrolase [Melioribacteraceae bacterium]